MGNYLAWFIYTKPILGFMGIYITHDLSINPHITHGLSINPHKSKHGFIINEICEINPHNQGS